VNIGVRGDIAAWNEQAIMEMAVTDPECWC
jgi:hypothetical protein